MVEQDMNPVSVERIARAWTSTELAENAGIKLQTVYDTEKGTLSMVPKRIMDALNVNYEITLAEYHAWQTRQRRKIVMFTPESDTTKRFIERNMNLGAHPFEAWMTSMGLSLTHFCEAVKVSRKSVVAYIDFQQKSLPQAIRDALLECDWGEDDSRSALDTLIRLGEEFFERSSQERLAKSRNAGVAKTSDRESPAE